MAVVLKLKYPIQANGETVTEITFPDRLKVKHLRVLDKAKGDVERAVLFLSEVGQLPPSAVDQIDAADFLKLGELIASFFPSSLETGAT